MKDFIRMERQELVKEAVYSLRNAKYSSRRKLPPDVANALVQLEAIYNQIIRRSSTIVTHEQIAGPIEIAHAFVELMEAAPCAR